MRDVFIIGAGMTPFGKHKDKGCAELARMAVSEALKDAGVPPDGIGASFYANTAQGAIEGQYGIKGQLALRPLGIERSPFVNIENACCGSSAALYLAWTQVAGGFADVALAVGTEKLYTDDREKKLAVFNQKEDTKSVSDFVATYMPTVADVQPPPEAVIDEKLRSIFMDAYAINARAHMRKYGTTWRQIAAVSAKNHHHSTMNPLSQFQNEIDIEAVLAARIIAWPLTLPMCAPVSDGAAATIICSENALKRFTGQPVKIRASVLKSGSDHEFGDYEKSACRLTAVEAFKRAGLTPKDISVAEVHDGSAFAEISQLELTGLCEPGMGGKDAESGATALGGRIPVNVSGGLESKGHPIAATGLAQIHELVLQLRGTAGKRTVEKARFGMAVNGGGFIGVEEAVSCITILERV